MTITAGEARGVEARTAGGHSVTVRSRAVVAACGALNTPALLRRSGLRNPNIGKHLQQAIQSDTIHNAPFFGHDHQ